MKIHCADSFVPVALTLFAFTLFFTPIDTEGSAKVGEPYREYDDSHEQPIDDQWDGTDGVDYSSYTNLEKFAQPFVLETKQIKIKEYPTAFNPTIVRWMDSIVLSFRIRNAANGSTDQIGMVWLDENLDLASPPVVLEVPPYPSPIQSKQQDPRLIQIGGEMFMVYSNVVPGVISKEVRRVFLTKVHYDNGRFYTDAPEMISTYDEEREQRWEKNWTPFEFCNELYLVYSFAPHKIFKPILGTGVCETVASTSNAFSWPWGTLRGGSQAYLLDGGYLSFFHSSLNMETVHSKGKNIQHYVMGAYMFSRDPPFEITYMSPEPIVGKGFYSGPEYKTWKPLRVVFPDGYIYDDKYIWVSYGRQDHEMWIAKIDRRQLLESLVPVDKNNDFK